AWLLELAHEAIVDAPRRTAGYHRRDMGVPGALALEHGAIGGIGGGFRRKDEGGAQLSATGSQRHGSPDALSIHDAASRHDGQIRFAGDQAHERHGAQAKVLPAIKDAA